MAFFFLSERRLKAFKIWSTSLLADPSFISLYKPLRERFVKESFVNFAAPKNQKATTINSLEREQHREDHHFFFKSEKPQHHIPLECFPHFSPANLEVLSTTIKTFFSWRLITYDSLAGLHQIIHKFIEWVIYSMLLLEIPTTFLILSQIQSLKGYYIHLQQFTCLLDIRRLPAFHRR